MSSKTQRQARNSALLACFNLRSLTLYQRRLADLVIALRARSRGKTRQDETSDEREVTREPLNTKTGRSSATRQKFGKPSGTIVQRTVIDSTPGSVPTLASTDCEHKWGAADVKQCGLSRTNKEKLCPWMQVTNSPFRVVVSVYHYNKRLQGGRALPQPLRLQSSYLKYETGWGYSFQTLRAMKERQEPSTIQLLITVLPVLSASLYLLGLTYHQGYLSGYMVNESLFPLASDQALYTGLYSLIALSFPGIFYALVTFLVFVAVVMVAGILSSTRRVRACGAKIKRFLKKKFRAKQTPSAAVTKILDKSAVWYGYLTGFVVVILAVLLMCVVSIKNGREQAEREIGLFAEDKKSAHSQVFPPLPAFPGPARLIVCSESHCAFWSGKESFVVRSELIDYIVSSHGVEPSPENDKTVVTVPQSSPPNGKTP